MGAFLKRLAKHPEKAMAKFSKVADAKGMSIDEKELKSSGLDDDYLQHMMQGFFETVGKTDIRSVKNQFYSDLVTKLDNGICVPGTKIHVFHSEKMGDKYLKRYHKHYEDPEIIPFPCGHEGWLGNPQLMIETFHRCMKTELNKEFPEGWK
jgi:hypothetical protein